MSKYNVGHTYTKCSFIENLKFTFNRVCCILPGCPNSSGGNGLCKHLEVAIQEDVNLREIRRRPGQGKAVGSPAGPTWNWGMFSWQVSWLHLDLGPLLEPESLYDLCW